MRPRPSSFSISIGLLACVLGCGGNVAVGTGGAGGAGGAGGGTTTGTATASTTSSTGTGGSLPDDFTACDGPGQCTLVTVECCPPCGMPELPDVLAVHVAQGMAYKDYTCPDPVDCPACETGYNPHLFAYCDTAAGKCVAADTRTHAVSACTADEQCALRNGTECCENCNELQSYELTAVASGADPSLMELVCAPEIACPPCVPIYPADVIAICSNDGHCQVLPIDK